MGKFLLKNMADNLEKNACERADRKKPRWLNNLILSGMILFLGCSFTENEKSKNPFYNQQNPNQQEFYINPPYLDKKALERAYDGYSISF